jgi:hypothetical protein
VHRSAGLACLQLLCGDTAACVDSTSSLVL